MPVPLLKVDASFLFLNPEQKRGTTMTISRTTAHEPTGQNESETVGYSNSPQKFDFLTQAQNEPDSFPSEIHKVSWDKLST